MTEREKIFMQRDAKRLANDVCIEQGLDMEIVSARLTVDNGTIFTARNLSATRATISINDEFAFRAGMNECYPRRFTLKEITKDCVVRSRERLVSYNG